MYKIDLIPKCTKKNKGIFPVPFRCMISGTSGCGKTTFLYNLILQKWGIPFHYLYIFSQTLEQDAYQNLKNDYEILSAEEDNEIAYFFNNCEELIPVNECESNSLLVFDDCVNVKQQEIIKDYFSYGRNKNISCIYLTQCYTKVDSQLIRNNINFLCIFKQSIKHIKIFFD
jgi:predicted AAA+ superfamily ATPase